MKKSSPLGNFLYKAVERAGAQIVSLIVTIELARIIGTDECGAVELILVLVSLCQVFVQVGLNSALVQKKDVQDMDFSAVFYANLFVGILLYSVLFFTAPLVESFYNIESLGTYLRICGLIIIPSSYNSIQNAYMAKNYMFNKQMICCLLASIFSGIVGITLAVLGFGIWSYVLYQITSAITTPLFCKIVVPWHPGRIDTIKRVFPLYRYGIKILGANLMETLYNDISSLVIGKKFTSSDLAYYGKGKQFPQAISNIFNGSLTTVSFPYFSEAQDDFERTKNMTRITVRVASFVIFPILLGLAAVSRPLVITLLKEKWLDSIPYLRMMCIVYISIPIYTINSQAINAIGRSDIHLKVEILKKVINIGALVISIVCFDSVNAIIISQIVTMPIVLMISFYPLRKIFQYRFREMLADIFPPLIISIIMYIAICMFDHLNISSLIILVMEVIIGVLIYVICNVVTKNKNYLIAKEYLKKLLAR